MAPGSCSNRGMSDSGVGAQAPSDLGTPASINSLLKWGPPGGP